jgi:hypothetical protein
MVFLLDPFLIINFFFSAFVKAFLQDCALLKIPFFDISSQNNVNSLVPHFANSDKHSRSELLICISFRKQ